MQKSFSHIQEIDCSKYKLLHKEKLRGIYHYFSAAKNANYIVITLTHNHPHPDFATKFNILLYDIEKNCWKKKQVVKSWYDELAMGKCGVCSHIPWSWHDALNSKNGDLHIICSYRYVIYNIDTEQLKIMPNHGMGIPKSWNVKLSFIPIDNNDYELNLYGVQAQTIHYHSIYRSVDKKVIDLDDRIQDGINYRCYLNESDCLWIPTQKRFIIFGGWSLKHKIYFLDNSLTSEYNTKISDIKEPVDGHIWWGSNTVLLYDFIVMRVYYNRHTQSNCIWLLNLLNNKWHESAKKIRNIST